MGIRGEVLQHSKLVLPVAPFLRLEALPELLLELGQDILGVRYVIGIDLVTTGLRKTQQ